MDFSDWGINLADLAAAGGDIAQLRQPVVYSTALLTDVARDL